GAIVDYYPNLTRRDRAERELAPHLIIARNAAAGYRRPGRAVPVLHVEGSDAVVAERHAQRRLDRVLGVLLRNHVDLIDRLAAVEIDFDPVREAGAGPVQPDSAVAARGPRAIINVARVIVVGRTQVTGRAGRATVRRQRK